MASASLLSAINEELPSEGRPNGAAHHLGLSSPHEQAPEEAFGPPLASSTSLTLGGASLLDETQGAASLCPELLCAVSCPFHITGRIYRALGGPSFLAVTVTLGVLWCIASIGSLLADDVDRPEAVAWLAVYLLIVALWVPITAFLRAAARARLGGDGKLTAADCCLSVPWCFCVPCAPVGYAYELALMHRRLQAAGLSGAAAAPPTPPPPAESFSTTLLGCSPALDDSARVAEYQCAAGCPWFVQLRLFLRLGLAQRGSWRCAAGLLALYAAPALLLVIAIATIVAQDPDGWEEDDPRGAPFVFAAVLIYAFALTLLPGTVYLRSKAREAYGIAGSLWRDAALSCCCWGCVLAQLERESTARAGVTTSAMGDAYAAVPPV